MSKADRVTDELLHGHRAALVALREACAKAVWLYVSGSVGQRVAEAIRAVPIPGEKSCQSLCRTCANDPRPTGMVSKAAVVAVLQTLKLNRHLIGMRALDQAIAAVEALERGAVTS